MLCTFSSRLRITSARTLPAGLAATVIVSTHVVVNDLGFGEYAVHFIACVIACPCDYAEVGIAIVGLIPRFRGGEADAAADRKRKPFGQMGPEPFDRWAALCVLGRATGVRKAM